MQASIVQLGLYRVILYIRILYPENNQTNVKYLKPTTSPAAIPRSAVPPGGQGQGQGQGQGRTRSDGGSQSGTELSKQGETRRGLCLNPEE